MWPCACRTARCRATTRCAPATGASDRREAWGYATAHTRCSGLSADHARVYLFGRILHFRGSLYYDHQTDAHRGFAAAQAEALIGPIQRVGRIYGVLSAGADVQFRQNGADAAAHPTVGFGLGVPLRPGYHVGANLEAFCLRPIGKDQRTQWAVVLKVPMIRF